MMMGWEYFTVPMLTGVILLSEGPTGRTLIQGVDTTGGATKMTVSLCTSACKTAGFNLAGVEYGGECCKSTSSLPAHA